MLQRVMQDEGQGTQALGRSRPIAVAALLSVVGLVLVLALLTPRSAAAAVSHARSSARTTTAASDPPRYDPAPATDRFGVNGQVMFWELPGLNWIPLVSEIHTDDIQVVRADAPWESVQPTAAYGAAHIYDWAETDAVATSLAQQGLRWMPVIDYSAPWAASGTEDGQPDIYSAPRSDAEFAAYAAAVVARYGPGGTFWRTHPSLPDVPVTAVEIWNEENTSIFWHPSPDASAYLALYEAARSAIHAVTSRVEALVGGLVNPSSAFLDAMYIAGHEQRDLFDGVAIHPYGATPTLVLHNVILARRTLDAHGDYDVGLDITEVGWPSLSKSTGLIGTLLPPSGEESSGFITDALRATDLTDVTQQVAASDCGVERIFPETWVSSQASDSQAADWFGIVSPSGVQSQTARAYSRLIATLEGEPEHASTSLCGRVLSVSAARLAASVRTRRSGRAGAAGDAGRACVQATVTSHGTRLDGATVTFTEIAPRTGAPSQRISSLTGTATDCVGAAAGHTVTFEVTAARADFSNVPTARARATAHRLT